MAFLHTQELKQYIRELKADLKRADKEIGRYAKGKNPKKFLAAHKWFDRVDKELNTLRHIVNF